MIREVFALADVTSSVLNTYRREYMYKRLVDYVNSIPNGPKVTTSMARQLRVMTNDAMAYAELKKRVEARPDYYRPTNPDGSPKPVEEQDRITAEINAVNPFNTFGGDETAFSKRVCGTIIQILRDKKYDYVTGVRELYDGVIATSPGPDGRPVQTSRPEFDAALASFAKEFDDMAARGVVPLSPYDPRVANRDAFMNAGRECLYASYDDIASGAGAPLSMRLNRGELPLYAAGDDVGTAKKALRTETVSSAADRSGFSRLRPYLSTEDYNAVARAIQNSDPGVWNMRQEVYVQNGRQLDPTREPQAFARARAARAKEIKRRRDPSGVRDKIRGGQVILDRAEAILKYLRSEGIDFKVQPNVYDGQVILEFNNGTQLRLIDTQNPAYSGLRMYQDGREIILKADRQTYENRTALALSKGERVENVSGTPTSDPTWGRIKWVPHLNASAEESVAFVKYVLGRDVDTFGPNPHPVGSAVALTPFGDGSDRRDAGKILYRSVHTADRFYADMGSFTDDRQQRHYLCVDFNADDKSSTDVTYVRDGAEARAWLTEKINSARQNFVDAVDVDGLVRTYNEMRASGEVTMPAFCEDADISYIQRQYWDILTGAQETLVRPGHDMESDEGDNLNGAMYDVREDPDVPGRRYFEHNGQQFDMSADADGTAPGREAMIRTHLAETLDQSFGSFEKTGPENLRFNPAYVARFMTSPYSLYRDIDDIVAVSKAYMSATRPHRAPDGSVIPPEINDTFTPADLRGDDFTTMSVRERLLVFDDMNAQPMMNHPDPFIREMYGVVKSSLESNGSLVRPEDIEIDGQGIVRYKAESMFTGALTNARTRERRPEYHPVPAEFMGGVYGDMPQGYREWQHTITVTGQIGRILAPREDGMVFDGKYYHAPGYTGTIRANRFGEDAPYEARVVVTGYKQTMISAIRDRIRRDMLESRSTVGDTTAIDNVLRHLYDTRYGEDFYDRTAEDGMSDELRSAIVKTNTQRVKLDAGLMDKANRVAVYQNVATAHMGGDFGGQAVQYDPYVDNDSNPVTLVGGRNVAINESQGDGYFDPRGTGNGGAQGTRYLAEGVRVTDDGHLVPAEIPYREGPDGTLEKDLSRMPRCALMEYLRKSGRMADYDAVDRGNMTFNGLLHCIRETDRVGVAQMSFGGWTLEDGLVVTKAFAEKYRVPDAEHPNTYRPITSGDKIECHGNKGVVSIVIDPDMPEAEAREQGIWDQVQWFRNNPSLDVVMSPYSHVSRFNSGLGAEAMGFGAENGADESEVVPADDLTAPDGRVIPGAIGHVKLTILEQTADVKTHFTEDGSPKRSYGAQAGWGLAAGNCPAILEDSFKDNSKSLVELREMLIMCGMDISETGKLMRGYHAQPGEERKITPFEPIIVDPGTGRKQPKKTVDAFMEEIARSGGFVEIPFQLEFPRFNVGSNFDFADHPYSKEGFARSRCDRGNRATMGFLDAMPADSGKTYGQKTFGMTYRLPVVSSYMRSGQEFEDGKAIYHEWTNSYRNIYRAAVDYQSGLMDILVKADPSLKSDPAFKAGAVEFENYLEARRLSGQDVSGLERARDRLLAKYQRKAQGEFDKITGDIVSRKLESKHNVFRTGIMANKQTNSATAIWTADPRLGVDEVGINPDMAKALGIRNGEYCLIHRDPVLRDGGMRYMKAVLDPRLVGISVNPAGVPKPMDGDFDGDTIGVHKPGSAEANREAMENLSVYANLLDPHAVDKDSWNPATRTYERHKLFIAGGQDIAAGLAVNPELQKHYDRIEAAVNRFENEAKRGELSKEDLMARRKWAVGEINKFLTDAYDAGIGRNIISYASKEAHMESIMQYVNDKAKGNPGKLETYANSMGMSVRFSDDGKHVKSVEALPNGVYSDEVRESNVGILQAKNMQTEYTGFAGMFSIRAAKALYNVDPKSALELTYMATQAVLQVKHDAEMADRYETILSGPARWVWRGYKLQESTDKFAVMKPTGEFYTDKRTGKTVEKTERAVTEVPTWSIVRDDKGRPVQATHAEFVQQFMDVYASKKGMGLDVNQEFVYRLADLLSEGYDPGVRPPYENPKALAAYYKDLDGRKMMDIETTAVDVYGATLQKLAYNAKLKDVAELATSGAGLFDVPTEKKFGKNFNICMADEGIMKKNLAVEKARAEIARGYAAAEQAGRPADELEAIRRRMDEAQYTVAARSDVLVDGVQRTQGALMGHKLAKSTHSDGFQPEAKRTDGRTVNPADGLSASTPGAQPQDKPAHALPRDAAAEALSGRRDVPGPFEVPGATGGTQAAKPAPEKFPTGSGYGVRPGPADVPFGVDLGRDIPAGPSPAPAAVPDYGTEPSVPAFEEVPPEFLSSVPADSMADGVRSVPEADEIERSGGRPDNEDDMNPPW